MLFSRAVVSPIAALAVAGLCACTGAVPIPAGANQGGNSPQGGTPPAAPSGAAATALSATSVQVTWSYGATDVTGLEVERSASPSSGFVQVAAMAAPATSRVDSGLSPSTTYYYRVRATNGAGNSPYSNVASATTASSGSTVTDVTAAFSNLSHRAIFFAHASVGANILTGLGSLLAANSGAEPSRYSYADHPAVPTPDGLHVGTWADYAWYDLNQHPWSKVSTFQTLMTTGGMGAVSSLAFMKFCFVDFDAGSDSVEDDAGAARLFDAYKTMVAAVEGYAGNSGMKLVHFTAALTAGGNGHREAFNQRLRNQYGSTGRLFDLADLESNGHVDAEGRILDPAYNTGDDHLNSTGQAVVAKALVLFLANVP